MRGEYFNEGGDDGLARGVPDEDKEDDEEEGEDDDEDDDEDEGTFTGVAVTVFDP